MICTPVVPSGCPVVAVTVAPTAGGVMPAEGDGLAAEGDGLAADGEGLAPDGDGDGLAAEGEGEAPVDAVGVVPVVPPPQATRIALPAATAENFRNLLLLSFSLVVVTIYYLPLEVIKVSISNGINLIATYCYPAPAD